MKVQTSTDGRTSTAAPTIESVPDVCRIDLEGNRTGARYVRVERASVAMQSAGDLEFHNVPL